MTIGTGLCRSRAVCAAVFAAGALLVGAAPALADTTITVSTTLSSSPSGDGLCSLAEAVDWSQGGADPDCSTASPSGTTTIKLPAGKYVVPHTLFLNYALDIVGAGAGQTDIDGGGSAQVMYAYPGANVTISGIEISGGNSGISCSGVCFTPTPGNDGGGIYNDGTMVLEDDVVTGNTTGAGTSGILICFFAPCTGYTGAGGGNGGGIFNSGTLRIDGSTVSGNTTGAGAAGGAGVSGSNTAGGDGGDGGRGGGGGGIYNYSGALTITNSTISDNATGAGGNGGDGSAATLTNSNGGSAGKGGDAGSGGGIEVRSGSLTISGSTLDGNRTGGGSAPGAPGAGLGSGTDGAINAAGHGGVGGALVFDYPAGPTATLSDDTLTGNATGAAATGTDPSNGGIAGAIGFYGTGTLTNVTIAGNSSSYGAGAIYVIPGSTLSERNSIIASNRAGLAGTDNCAGFALTDGGHNVVFGENTCPGTLTDPKLGTLADNGGPTQTMRLGAGSSAIDLVPASACSLTTDQRGVGRPQGGGCDAGAYELAPPGLSGLAASATGPTSATVSGQITPNLQDTQVTVRYGTSTAYGSTTAATDLGTGSTGKALGVTLSGLQAGTAYHVQVVATNADGTSTSADLTLTTPAAMTASVAKTRITGNVVAVTVACAPGGASCGGALKLTSRLTTLGRRVVKVTAASAGHRLKRRTSTRTVGSGSYALTAGQTKIVKLMLNSLGKRLLKTRRVLPATLRITGVPALATRVTFHYKAPRRRKR